jgi:glycosyltransferase involved in cell wall biosynthesis
MLVENNPYPQDARVRMEAGTLAAAGYRVTVIAPGRYGQPWHELVGGVRVYRYPGPPERGGVVGYLLEYGYSLAAACVLALFVFLSDRFDVIHAHNPPDMLVLLAACYKPLGVKFVFDQHDLSPEMYDVRFGGKGSPAIRWLLILFEHISFRLADHVIATNQSYKAVAMERGGLPDARVSVVRNGPDLRRVRPVEPDPALRAKGAMILGYVGQMGVHDGIDYLLRAIRHLVVDLRRTEAYCVIIGGGEMWEELRAMAASLGIERHIWFTGRVSDDELVRYLSTADICLDPDPLNPFNDRSTMIKMLEYMALGKPIVAFDLTEHRVSARGAALYARPNDELDFARRIAELMDDPERRERMGALGRARVEQELAWDHSVPGLLRVYQELLPLSCDETAPSQR